MSVSTDGRTARNSSPKTDNGHDARQAGRRGRGEKGGAGERREGGYWIGRYLRKRGK